MRENIVKIPYKEFSEFKNRAPYLYKIRSEDNRLINYDPNEAQQYLEKIRNEEFERSKEIKGSEQCKIILLKGRQVGGTTDTAMFNMDIMLNLNMAYGLILAHNRDSTPIIYEKYRQAYLNLPDKVLLVDDNGEPLKKNGEPMLYWFKPEFESFSSGQLKFSTFPNGEKSTESRILVRTAGSGESVGRGDTLNMAHLCLGKDSKIVLSDGSTKRVETVEIGDKIITSSGNIAKISAKFNTGKKKVYKLSTWLSNEEIYPTGQHKILTKEGYKFTSDLTTDDWVSLPNITLTNEIKDYTYDLEKGRNIRWSTTSGVKRHTFKLNYNFGYFLGYYLAEGHINIQHNDKKKFPSINFCYHEDENYINKIIKDFGNLTTSIKHIECKNSKRKETIFYGSFLAHCVESICGRVKDKKIPEWFFKTNKNFIKGVLNGYFDGDGSKTQSVQYTKDRSTGKNKSAEFIYEKLEEIKKGKLISEIAKEIGFTYQGVWLWTKKFDGLSLEEIKKKCKTGRKKKYDLLEVKATSICEKISRQIKRLIITLDYGVPSLYRYEDVYRYDKRVSNKNIISLTGTCARNFLNNSNLELNGNTQKFTNKHKKINGRWYVKVKSIEPYKQEQTYDIEVDHPDHNFETPIGIVSNSELSFYEYGSEVLTAVNQSLPSNSYVYCVVESTANGISGNGEAFYNLWDKSTKGWKRFKNGITDTFEGYRPVFIPWYIMSKYRKPLVNGKLIDIENIDWNSPEKKQEHLQMEDKLIEEIFDDKQQGLEAVNWYRWCIKENCQYDIIKANTEYPSTAEMAFIATDKSFFDTPKLFVVKNEFEKNGEPERDRGELNNDGEFVKNRFGELHVWSYPKKGWKNRFICSLDPSEGRDGDYSCIMVFDRLEEKFVAKWYGNYKEDIVARELLKLAYFYNEALIIPERNLSTVITLIEPDGEIPYTGDIYYQNIKSRGFDWGYYTHNNKKDLLTEYNTWLRKDYSKIPDKATLEEHITFIKEIVNGRPKYEASPGNHDDMLIACLDGNTWIKTKDGAKRIKDIGIGDEVLTHKGRYKKVTAKSRRKSKQINRLKATGRPDLLITDEHPVLCFRTKRYGKYSKHGKINNLYYDEPHWNSVELSLTEKKYGVGYKASEEGEYPKKIDLLKYAPDSYEEHEGKLISFMSHNGAINNKAAVIDRYISVDKDFCRLLGYFYAEGCASNHTVTFASHDDEKRIRKWLTKYIERLGIKVAERPNESENGTILQFGNQILSNYLQTFKNKENKILPNWVENLPIDLKKELIVGAFIGDASFVDGTTSYCTISYSGGFQLYDILVSCGLRPTFYYNSRRKGFKAQLFLCLGRPDTQTLLSWFGEIKEDKKIGDTSYNRDQTKMRFQNDYLLGKINSITKEDFEDYVYNISVQDDESYAANGIIVHNCALCIHAHHWWDREIFQTETDDTTGIINIKKQINRRTPIRSGQLGKPGQINSTKSRRSYTELGK